MSLGIYLHIPFCKQKCLYCDFNSYAGKELLMDEYCDALKMEIIDHSSNEKVDSIYFGGGTPTMLGSERLAELLQNVRESYEVTEDCEITAECNPGTIDEKGLSQLREAGFNRLSIGVQATEDETLKRLGRIHSFDEFRQCFESARRVGFENLSLDLMYGLPDQTIEEWSDTLKKTLLFHPEHISCYGLKIEEGTPFASMNLSLPDDDTIGEMYDICVKILRESGYDRYEISNFARQGYESRHNLKYWRCDDFLGFGAGAYSCVNGVRYDNVCGIKEYCMEFAEKKTAIEGKIILSEADQMSEFCFLGLRTVEGISADSFRSRFGKEMTCVFGDVLKKNLDRGTILYQDGFYRIAPEFLFVSNSILTDFV